MNYTLQVVKGRSDVGALRLIDGINSVGRHDDCVIRIRSSQVSRRHCEIFEADDRLMVRDLGSSNGTYVNGKRVLGQQPLNVGDVIGIGGVSLRVDPAGGHAPGAGAAEPGSDTAELEAVVDAVEVDEADDFEVGVDVEVEEDGFDLNLDEFPDAIPLDDEPKAEPEPAKAKKSAKKPDQPATPAPAPDEDAKEDDAVAQFLMDLKLDEDD